MVGAQGKVEWGRVVHRMVCQRLHCQSGWRDYGICVGGASAQAMTPGSASFFSNVSVRTIHHQ